MREVNLLLGDCLEVLRGLPDCSVDACVTDPPYGLSFMGKAWDHSVPSVEVWREVLRVLKPGAHLLAFFGTRTYHRGVVAIEDAGFEVRDQIGWAFGSGFPKSLNLKGDWQGWGTALKPAWEPIVVARKPFAGTVAGNVLEWGTGAINVDGCRVGTESTRRDTGSCAIWAMSGRIMGGSEKGRWPANLIHDGSDEVVGLLGDAARFFYQAKASKADRDSGISGFRVIIDRAQLSTEGLWAPEENQARLLVDMEPSHPRVIGAFGALNNDATEWSTLLFGSGKTDQFQQGTTCTIETETSSTIESKILSCFQRLITSENTAVVKLGMANGGSRVEIVERGSRHLIITSENLESAHGAEDAALKTRWRISVDARRNDHVTVKPTDLMRYLCRLVTPPGGVVLDPFMGSGSTGRGAVLEGFGFTGIEIDPEYLRIAQARIEAAASKPAPRVKAKAKPKVVPAVKVLGQLSLFNVV